MAVCNICGRKETKKRVICEQKICSECLRKLKESNYVLINANKDNENALSDRSIIIEQNHLLQNELDDDENDILRIKSIIKDCLNEVNERNNNAINILNNHIEYLKSDIEHKNIIINDLLDGLRNINGLQTPTTTTKETNISPETYIPFKTSRQSNSKRHTVHLEDDNDIVLTNRFRTLQLPDEDHGATNKYMYDDDVNIITNNQSSRKTR